MKAPDDKEFCHKEASNMPSVQPKNNCFKTALWIDF
jgi:hypothetical protein